MTRVVLVRAPSRLHFGLMSFDPTDRPQFGGVGVMISTPTLELRIRSADAFAVRGLLAKRVDTFARKATDHWGLDALPHCVVEITSTPPAHHGLGSGTQLALSIAAGLRTFLKMPPANVRELSQSVGRGGRSSVGVYGFVHGGLVVDAGHLNGETLGRLETRIPMPDTWRFVLVRAAGPAGRSGAQEQQAFAELPPVPDHIFERLFGLATEQMVPAVKSASFADFSEHLYEYGRTAGECFASYQGGPFASPAISQLVEELRARGIRGVGQSSWGPTVFALAENDAHANDIACLLRRDLRKNEGRITITAPCNTGARVDVLPC